MPIEETLKKKNDQLWIMPSMTGTMGTQSTIQNFATLRKMRYLLILGSRDVYKKHCNYNFQFILRIGGSKLFQNWYWRSARRFVVVFISGGIIAVTQKLNLVQLPNLSQTIFVTSLIVVLKSFDKSFEEYYYEMTKDE